MKMSRAARFAEEGNLCSFGITESIGAAIATGLGALGAGGTLVGTAAAPGLLSLGLAGAGLGAAGGAGLGALTGEGAGKGALFGGLTGGAVAGLGPALGSLGEAAGLPAGVASTAGDVAAGLGAGAAGAAATGQPILTGTLEGGATGLAAGLGSAGSSTAIPAATPAASAVPPGGVSGASASAAAPAAGPTSLAAPGSLDLTGNILGPSATTPAAGSGAFGNYGLTDTGYTPGAVSSTPLGAAGGGGASPASFNANLDLSTLPQAPGTFYVPGTSTPLIPGVDAATGGVGGTLDSIASAIGKNPGVLASGGLLALEAMKQNQPLPEQNQLNQQAAQAAATGNQLASYVSSGTLPPGAQESINLATNAAKAQVRSTAATLGLSGSTWEADRMAQIDQQASAQGEQIATNLLQQGATYSQLSSSIFENLLRSTLSQDQAFSSALGNFAAGLAGARLPGGATPTTTGVG